MKPDELLVFKKTCFIYVDCCAVRNNQVSCDKVRMETGQPIMYIGERYLTVEDTLITALDAGIKFGGAGRQSKHLDLIIGVKLLAYEKPVINSNDLNIIYKSVMNEVIETKSIGGYEFLLGTQRIWLSHYDWEYLWNKPLSIFEDPLQKREKKMPPKGISKLWSSAQEFLKIDL